MLAKNNISAPLLVCAALMIVILFHSVVLVNDTKIAQNEIASLADMKVDENFDVSVIESLAAGEEYIFYNGQVYRADRLFGVIAIMYVCAYLLTGIFYVRLKKDLKFKNLNIRLPKLRYIPFIFFCLFFLILGTLLINALFFSFKGEALYVPYLRLNGGYVQNVGVMAVFMLLPALCKEFLFRSLLLHEYDFYAYFSSVIITTVMYALSDFSGRGFFVCLFSGFVFCLAARVTGSAVYSVILHFCFNFYIIYVNEGILEVLRLEQSKFMFIFLTAVTFLLAAILLFSSMERLFRKEAYSKGSDSQKAKSKRKFSAAMFGLAKSFCSPSFLLLVIIYFAYMIMRAA